MFSKGKKSKTIKHLKSLCTKIQIEIGHPIVRIKSDREREFDNVSIEFFFCDSNGSKHEYSTLRTTQ